uniref:Transmembrane inner ear n=1 Tax=Angiostrongylus cantonensis TaxID=6313 RepID=A0A0K0DC02_ANGCA
MAIASQHQLSALDQHIAPGLRLWMLIALVLGVLLIMVVLVCCFIRIRIPRTKRQIDLIAAKRKMRNKKAKDVGHQILSQILTTTSSRRLCGSKGDLSPGSGSCYWFCHSWIS